MEFVWNTIGEISLLLLVAAIVCVAISCVYGLKAYRKAYMFAEKECDKGAVRCPKVSVIVYSQSREEELMRILAQINEQDYSDFEVIVVCDASSQYAADISEKVAVNFPHVYVTFVQPGSHNLSRRKLATTIGMKAAKGEVVVTTVANATIPSERWLSSLIAPFCGEQGRHTDVSLGVSYMDFSELRGPMKWYRQFDTVLTNALWIGYAAMGRPYRGDGYNLAIRRSVFFEHKGYARTINLHNGDDDMFVNEISDGSNTAVVVSDDSIVTTHWEGSANRVWAMRKERYSFTSRWLPHAPFVRSFVQMGLQWVIPALCVAGWLVSMTNLTAAVAAGVILLAFWGTEIYTYRRLAARMGAVRLWWAVVPFWLWRPVGDMFFRFEHRTSRKKNFTWQR